MILERIYDDGLAQATYIVASESTHEAIVIDPARDIDRCLRTASARSLRIAHVTETHIHADFLSGARALAARAGAELHLSAEGGDDWQYAYATSDEASLLRDGDVIRVGDVSMRALHTPGHTPEHLAFLVTDHAASTEPIGLLTGDFVFVGDVGRPDLLERAARVEGAAAASARALFASIQRLRSFPDHLQLWPGHGAGSACGKALGAMPSSTLGYERLINWAFAVDDEETFVERVLAGQPEPPTYFARMKRLNRDGPPPMVGAVPPRAGGDEIAALIAEPRRGRVIDIRPTAAFGARFIPGSINLPAGSSAETWAGTLLDADAELILLVPGGHFGIERSAAQRMATRLARIGLDRVVGFAGASVIDEWADAGRPVASLPRLTAAEVAAEQNATVIDVRGDAEWDEGHIPSAVHIFLGDLAERARAFDPEQRLIVSCQGGSRSSTAGSLLRARGFTNVLNFAGGMNEWARSHRPVASERTNGGE